MNRKELMLQSQSVTQIATDLIKNTNTPSFTVIFMQQFTNSIITTRRTYRCNLYGLCQRKHP